MHEAKMEVSSKKHIGYQEEAKTLAPNVTQVLLSSVSPLGLTLAPVLPLACLAV